MKASLSPDLATGFHQSQPCQGVCRTGARGYIYSVKGKGQLRGGRGSRLGAGEKPEEASFDRAVKDGALQISISREK